MGRGEWELWAEAYVRSDPISVAKWFTDSQRWEEHVLELEQRGLTDVLNTTGEAQGKRIRELTCKARDGSTVQLHLETIIGPDGVLLRTLDGYRVERNQVTRITHENRPDQVQHHSATYDFVEKQGAITQVRVVNTPHGGSHRWYERLLPAVAARIQLGRQLGKLADRCERELAP